MDKLQALEERILELQKREKVVAALEKRLAQVEGLLSMPEDQDESLWGLEKRVRALESIELRLAQPLADRQTELAGRMSELEELAGRMSELEELGQRLLGTLEAQPHQLLNLASTTKLEDLEDRGKAGLKRLQALEMRCSRMETNTDEWLAKVGDQASGALQRVARLEEDRGEMEALEALADKFDSMGGWSRLLDDVQPRLEALEAKADRFPDGMGQQAMKRLEASEQEWVICQARIMALEEFEVDGQRLTRKRFDVQLLSRFQELEELMERVQERVMDGFRQRPRCVDCGAAIKAPACRCPQCSGGEPVGLAARVAVLEEQAPWADAFRSLRKRIEGLEEDPSLAGLQGAIDGVEDAAELARGRLEKRIDLLETTQSDAARARTEIREHLSRAMNVPGKAINGFERRLHAIEAAQAGQVLLDKDRAVEAQELSHGLANQVDALNALDGRVAVLETMPDEGPVVGKPFRNTKDLQNVLSGTVMGGFIPSPQAQAEVNQHVRNLQDTAALLQGLAEQQELAGAYPANSELAGPCDCPQMPCEHDNLPPLFANGERANLVKLQAPVQSLVRPVGWVMTDYVGAVTVEQRGEVIKLRGDCLVTWTSVGDVWVAVLGDNAMVSGKVRAWEAAGANPMTFESKPVLEVEVMEVKRYGDKAH